MSLRPALLAGLAAALLSAAPLAASPLTIDSVQGGAASGSLRYNFDALTLTNGTVFSSQQALPVQGVAGAAITVNLQANARVVQGNQAGQFAAPFLTAQNGVGFGPGGTDQPGVPGPDTTTYLSTGSSGHVRGAQIELVLPFEVSYFGLLWGSIDAYNTLSFYDGNTLVAAVTGAQVIATPNGAQNAQGTRYVQFSSTVAFDRVVATSTSFAFEFDNVALARAPGGGDPAVVPAPGAAAVVLLGLVGLGLALRRRG